MGVIFVLYIHVIAYVVQFVDMHFIVVDNFDNGYTSGRFCVYI